MEHESHPHHHPHGTGMRWLDITLAVAATIVSLVSLWLGLHSAHSMEKLVASNSYPYVEMMSDMGTEKPLPGTDRTRNAVNYYLANNGVGPARIEWVEMTFKGKPVANITELLEACCAGSINTSEMHRRGNIVSALVRPGDTVPLFTWEEQNTPNPTFDALRRQMGDIATSVCYCSVFDDCYVRNKDFEKPKPVKQCVAPSVAFQPDFRGG